MRRSLLILVAACGSTSPVGPVRFANQPPVWRVNDRVDTPKQPSERRFDRGFYHFDSYYLRANYRMNLTRERRALGVNALDEVPDSTWFTNRIGVRNLTADELRRGPGDGVAPDQHFPWTIKSGKEGGTAPGFIVEDARGVKFLLKFDQPAAPEVETGADVIVARLLWAAGYNVADDHVVYFRRGDIRLAPDAYYKEYGEKLPLKLARVDKQLASVTVGADGRMRGLASVFVPGKPVGGAPRLGVRADDPNDLIPHELRRDLRGQAPLFAWLSHTDMKEDNTLDTWVEDPADPSIHYVKHYLIDFGNALGTQALVRQRPYLGYQYDVDFGEMLPSLLSLGTYSQPWEGRIEPGIPGVGLYAVADYSPALFKPNTFGQLPLLYADRFDQFWGAKLAVKFTREQIAAAVAAAKLTNPRAASYLVDTIYARARKTARHWFRRVNPIDEFRVAGDTVCFTDLALAYGLEQGTTRFRVTAFDANAVAAGPRREVVTDPAGRVCVPVPSLAYAILRIESSRGMPGTLLHVASGRIVGVHRL